jgi:hypothetical protein
MRDAGLTVHPAPDRRDGRSREQASMRRRVSAPAMEPQDPDYARRHQGNGEQDSQNPPSRLGALSEDAIALLTSGR